MAISLITGLMGSGKSHQAVKYIIVPNYKQGRKILTNIKGINEDELIKYCLLDKSVKEENLGSIEIINDADITKDNFYPYLIEEDNKEVIKDDLSIVKAGDVVVIDEAAQFYTDNLTKENLVFFTMHRHFTNDDNLSCELCFLVQDYTLLNRKLVKLSKTIYITKKLDYLGFSKSYILKIYDGGTVRKTNLINEKKEKYDPLIFPIYSSYAKGKGKELNLDKRANILNNWKTYFVLVFIFLVPFALYKSLSMVKNMGNKDNKKIEETNKQENINNNDKQLNQNNITNISFSDSNFRIVGVINLNTKRLVMLEDENKRLKLVQPQLCIGSGLSMTCNIDGSNVSYYNKFTINQGETNENKNNNNISNLINKQ